MTARAVLAARLEGGVAGSIAFLIFIKASKPFGPKGRVDPFRCDHSGSGAQLRPELNLVLAKGGAADQAGGGPGIQICVGACKLPEMRCSTPKQCRRVFAMEAAGGTPGGSKY